MNIMKSCAKNNIVVFWYLVLFGLSVFQYYTITSYSMETAEKSTVESRAVSDRVNNLLDKINSGGEEKRSKLEHAYVHHITRKVAHIYVFFIYGFINMTLFYLASRGDSVKSFVATLLTGFFGASFDEISQLFVSGRAGRISDVLIDVLGVCFAYLMVFILIKFFRSRRKLDFERMII